MRHERIGRTRIRLAKILRESLGVECEPHDLKAAGGRQRNNTSLFDAYAWEVFGERNGITFVAGSFDTMTDCVKAGAVNLHKGEIYAGAGK